MLTVKEALVKSESAAINTEKAGDALSKEAWAKQSLAFSQLAQVLLAHDAYEMQKKIIESRQIV